METNIIDKFKSQLGRESALAGISGSDLSATRKDFAPQNESEEKDDNKKEKSIDYLKDGVTLKQIYVLVKNKKLSNNKIKQEIKKLLKNSEELDDFLRSFIKKETNEEMSLDDSVGRYTGSVSGVVGSRNENKEATSSGGGVGAYDAPLFGDMKEEKLKGGKADKKTFTDLVNKNKIKGKDIGEIKKELLKQLNKGIKVETEHTDDESEAKEIALDHLFEDPNYYDKLKKVETKEATSSGAGVGAYETPAAWAKTTSKKHWRGKSKTQIPGGKFVQVKKKCKRFPYCNQGDIKALNIFENETLSKVINEISHKYDIHRDLIEEIISNEFKKLDK